MSDLERRKREEPEKAGADAYLYLALGVGFLIATALLIATTGVAVSGIGFVIAAAACLGVGVSKLAQGTRSLPPMDHERELLSAIRDNAGSITPAEAAMETTLTVKDADRMLSELASGGHLTVESRGGALVYALPGREERELE